MTFGWTQDAHGGWSVRTAHYQGTVEMHHGEVWRWEVTTVADGDEWAEGQAGSADRGKGLVDHIGPTLREGFAEVAEEAVEEPEEARADEGEPVVLVACSLGKLGGRARALDMYTGPHFAMRRRWCKAVLGREPDGILSAKYGLVLPDQEIDDYDLTLTKMPAPDRRKWGRRVANEIATTFGSRRRFIVLAGADYAETWVDEIERAGGSVDRKWQGMGIGEQRRAMSQEIEGMAEQLTLG